MKSGDSSESVTASTRATPSPFERDLSRSSTPLRTQSALDTAYRGSPLPRVADYSGEIVNLDEFSDSAILGALLALPRADQGAVIGNWAHRLERSQTSHILQGQISRHCAKNAQVFTREVSTQTDIVGLRDLGDTSTDTLRHGIAYLKQQMINAKEALNQTSNGASLVRSAVREVHVAVIQTAGQAEIAATVTQKLVGHAFRTERRFSKENLEGMELPPHLQETEAESHELPEGVPEHHAESSDEESNHKNEGESRRPSKESVDLAPL